MTNDEFEPITPENIKEALEYNGFTEDPLNDFIFYNNDLKFVVNDGIYFFRLTDKEILIKHKDLNKVLDFMREFIDLKPLPKKPVFDPRHFLIDNGFFTNLKDDGLIMHDDLAIRFYKNDETFSIRYRTFKSTKENLQIVVEAAKLLGKLS